MTQDDLFGNPTQEERDLIDRIADRAVRVANDAVWDAGKHPVTIDRLDIQMDITATHHRCPLRLADLLNADEFNFAHDVFGIRRHLDRETGRLMYCFRPRFARPLPRVEDMSDEDLDAICQDSDHPQYEDACWEADVRQATNSDGRVAQAMGRASGEQPS